MIKAMEPLFLDIETTYTISSRVQDYIAAKVKPPANMSRPDTIAKWEAESKPDAVKEAVAKSALNGGYGYIVAIGYAVGDQEPTVLQVQGQVTERDILRQFFQLAAEEGAMPELVGHNLLGFDLPFIIHRAIQHGLRLPFWFPNRRNIKPWSNRVFDTMLVWAGDKGRISLDELAFVLGIEVKPTIKGEDVPRLFWDQKFQQIAEHNREDVRVVQAIYRRMKKAGL